MIREVWLGYVAAVVLLVSIPGPSQMLMLSGSLANGFRRSLAIAAGDLSANLLQMVAASAGLGAFIVASDTAFLTIKWCGVAYLAFLGIGRIVGARKATPACAPRRTAGSLWWDGFLTSAANPKAVLFFAALFPQFINRDGPLGIQLAILGATYIVLDGAFLSLYGGASSRIAARMGGTAGVWIDRLSGGLMLAAGLLLGSKTLAR